MTPSSAGSDDGEDEDDDDTKANISQGPRLQTLPNGRLWQMDIFWLH